MSTTDYFEKYQDYEEMFNPMLNDRQARRKRKPKANHVAKKATEKIIAETAETTGIEGEFTTTYTPSRYETGWLEDSVRKFYELEQITDILAQVKGGKEASVYRCAAHPITGYELLAAKVYRPRRFRSLSNDKIYREGRITLTGEGRPVKSTDQRVARAIGKKSDFGVQVEHTSWLLYEFTTMKTLYQAGAAVPEPLSVSDNAILMSYLGDESLAAPTLNEIKLEPDEAQPLFDEVMRNIELMLDFDFIHGDLSAYNILYWQGEITLIDFPQVVNRSANSQAYPILTRDVTRVCEYFQRFGVDCDPTTIVEALWSRFLEPEAEAADLSRLLASWEEE